MPGAASDGAAGVGAVIGGGKWLKPFGPKRLQEIIKQLQAEVDARTPIPGLGINVTDDKGKKISTKSADSVTKDPAPGASSSAGGSTVIATEFVTVETALTDGSDEELYNNEIPAGLMKTDGDCIRAVYSVRCFAEPVNVYVTFGQTNHVPNDNIADGTGLDVSSQGNLRIEVLIMRSGESTYRYVSEIVVDEGGTGANSTTICNAGGSLDDNSTDFTVTNYLTLWAAAVVPDALVGAVKARMALIEYIPA